MGNSLLVDDGFWEVLEPLLPARRPRGTGRPRVEDRAAFTAIVYVLVTGVPWRMVPKEIGCSGVTAWASAQGLAGGRGVGACAPRAAAPAERRRADRLVARDRRFKPYPRSSRGL